MPAETSLTTKIFDFPFEKRDQSAFPGGHARRLLENIQSTRVSLSTVPVEWEEISNRLQNPWTRQASVRHYIEVLYGLHKGSKILVPIQATQEKELYANFEVSVKRSAHLAFDWQFSAGAFLMPETIPAPQTRQVDHVIHSSVLKKEIKEVARSASRSDWDGEDALPVHPNTVSIAIELASLFPNVKQLPEVSASPHGEIDFDWAVRGDIMLTISVCRPPKHDIVFVATIGEAEVRGREPWKNTLPQLVGCCFERMIGWL